MHSQLPRFIVVYWTSPGRGHEIVLFLFCYQVPRLLKNLLYLRTYPGFKTRTYLPIVSPVSAIHAMWKGLNATDT